MKNNIKSQIKNKNIKNANSAAKKSAQKTCDGACRVTNSGLDRDILMNTALCVSLLVNMFFLVGAVVIGSSQSAAHTVGSLIYYM